MQLRFENRLDDIFAFNRYHWQTSTVLRRAQRRPLVGVAVVWLAGAVVLAALEQSPLVLAAGAVLTALGVGLTYLLTVWRQRQVTRQLLAEGANKSLYGWHELELDGDQLTKRSLYMTTTMDLRLIEQIAETPQHAFIYISGISALIVPRRDVADGDYEDFMEELRSRLREVRSRVEAVD
jgi:4-amino-4-deoxy-L-arabinose transferase-like glycosyltransferase